MNDAAMADVQKAKKILGKRKEQAMQTEFKPGDKVFAVVESYSVVVRCPLCQNRYAKTDAKVIEAEIVGIQTSVWAVNSAWALNTGTKVYLKPEGHAGYSYETPISRVFKDRASAEAVLPAAQAEIEKSREDSRKEDDEAVRRDALNSALKKLEGEKKK
jgi:hypothetical protein